MKETRGNTSKIHSVLKGTDPGRRFCCALYIWGTGNQKGKQPFNSILDVSWDRIPSDTENIPKSSDCLAKPAWPVGQTHMAGPAGA